MRTLGLYLHIPFCRSKCLYCDFCSLPNRSDEVIERYTSRLCGDVAAWGERCREYAVDTVFFGGGTPTLLNERQLSRIMEAVHAAFRVAPDAEITAECNPATGGRDLFRTMRRAGFNRLSIGLQSAHSRELKALGRLHDFDGFLRTWEEAREAGFDNLNADVMFGVPYQTRDSFLRTLESVTALRPEHLSAYALSLEEGTPLARMADRLPMPDEDETAAMYRDAVAFLAGQGLEQYEISNFARAGYQSRHNRKYWNAEEYLGLGPAAHSDLGGVRSGNSRDVDAYLRGEDVTAERSEPSRQERENEYVMLRMRLCEGLDCAAFRERFGHAPEAFAERLEGYVASGFVRRTAGGFAFTVDGFLVSNTILSDVVSFSGEESDGKSEKNLDKSEKIV